MVNSRVCGAVDDKNWRKSRGFGGVQTFSFTRECCYNRSIDELNGECLMQMAGLRFLTLGAVMVFGFGAGEVFAQETQKKAPVAPFVSQGSNTGATAPVFLSKPGSSGGNVINGVLPRQGAYGMKNANVASAPKNMEKAKIEYEANRAKQEALNQQIRDSRMQAAVAQFEASKAKDTAADEARLQAKREAAGLAAQTRDPNVVPTQTVPVEPVANPYAGSNVVFTNPKKDPNAKPARLFNTP